MVKSIFLFCDFGIPYTTILTLYNNNISLRKIVIEPKCMIPYIGNSSKYENIINLVSKVINCDYDYSLYDLIKYDLSEKIVKMLHDNNFHFKDISEEMIENEFITKSTYQRIIDSFNTFIDKNDVNYKKIYSIYNLNEFGLTNGIINKLIENRVYFRDISEEIYEYNFLKKFQCDKILECYQTFLKENNIKIELNKYKLLSIINEIYSTNNFIIKDLLEVLIQKNYETVNLINILTELVSEKKLWVKEQYYSLPKPKIIDELKKITNPRQYDMISKKLNGDTLESIGKDYSLTRERVRQIINKIMKNFSYTREEEKYLDLFQTYNFDKDLFCDLYNEDQIVYYYLKEKYNLGVKEPSDMIEDINLTKRQLEVLKNKYNLIKYFDEYVIIRKNNILKAILKRFNRLVEYDELILEYNKIINDYSLNIDMLSANDFRNIDSILERMPCVLCSVGRYYRYYDIDVLEDNDITELKEMLKVEPGDYSAEYFFNNNKLIMKKIDIRSEYELHNLLRKIIGDSEKDVTFSRMPDIFINCSDKYAFIENLIHELSPISIDDFTEYAYQNYGHKINTFKSVLLTNFNKYITNGIIMTDCAEFNESQILTIKEYLTEDIYSTRTIKELLTQLFNVEDFRLLNNLNMQKIGYRLRGNYIMKSTISNLEGYLKDYINSSDYFELKSEYKKTGSTITSYLYKFIYNLDLFKINDDKYITINKLNKMGITKEHIKFFISELEKVIKENEFFNLYSLDRDNYLSNLKKHNFPDCFYETIISTINDVKSFRVKNNVMFIKTQDQVTIEKFINSFINKDKIYIREIKDLILIKYNINLYEYFIKEFINTKKYYLDNSIDCVYLNRDLYEEDINEIDILQYID